MIERISPAMMAILTDGSRENRMLACELEPAYFAFYYFPELFHGYPAAPFHWDFFEDYKNIIIGEFDEVSWVAFRDSAKTTIAKVMVCHAICFKKKNYINWDSQDKTNAEQGLFDVATMLQTNQRLIADFGYLYKPPRVKRIAGEQAEPEMKRINEFITENRIKVEAFSTGTPTRGRQFYDKKTKKLHRPDWFILDDIENNKTKESLSITLSVISHYNEMKSGLGVTGAILVLGNFITEDGSVAHIINLTDNKDGKMVRFVPVAINGQPTWPGKYTMTNKEALAYNMDKPRNRWKVSLEKKREDLTDPVFEQEMMNNPAKSGDYYFDREIIKGLMRNCIEPKKTIAGLKIWDLFDASHRYGGGADTAEGIGADSNTAAVINFSKTPKLMAATFENNEISPSTHAWEIKRIGEYYGECFFVPEINNTGYATVAEMITIGYLNMYRREVKNRTNDKVSKEYGWRATPQTNHDIASQFKHAVETGDLVILDIDLLRECYTYTKAAHRVLKKEPGMTKHFDKLRAAMLAWEAGKHATLSLKDRKERFKAPVRAPYEV